MRLGARSWGVGSRSESRVCGSGSHSAAFVGTRHEPRAQRWFALRGVHTQAGPCVAVVVAGGDRVPRPRAQCWRSASPPVNVAEGMKGSTKSVASRVGKVAGARFGRRWWCGIAGFKQMKGSEVANERVRRPKRTGLGWADVGFFPDAVPQRARVKIKGCCGVRAVGGLGLGVTSMVRGRARGAGTGTGAGGRAL